jgi:hypothetical protein
MKGGQNACSAACSFAKDFVKRALFQEKAWRDGLFIGLDDKSWPGFRRIKNKLKPNA